MTASASPFLLFDLGGVLVDNAAVERLETLLDDPGDRPQLKARWLHSPAVRGFERGDLSPDQFASGFLAEWRLAMEPTDFLSEFSGWARGFYPGAEDLLRRLRGRYRVGCLSNSNELHWQRFEGFAAYFDVALSSHLLRAVKPDRDCFERALQALGLPAGEIVYFDDALPNVDAAAGFGLRVIHVPEFSELESRLTAAGLL